MASQPLEDNTPPFCISPDDVAGVIRINCHGIWSVPTAQTYALQLAAAVRLHRAKFGVLRLLIETPNIPEQNPEIWPIMNKLEELLDERDRVAVIQHSNVAKARLRQREQKAEMRGFMSGPSAEVWLLSN